MIVLTDETNITFRQSMLSRPGVLNHQMNVPDDASTHFDVHARRPDRRPLPLVRQHPRVGHVAVQAGRQHEEHDAHLVTFAAEMLARQPVAELVQHLRHAERDASQMPFCGREELVEARQLLAEFVKVGGNDQQRQLARIRCSTTDVREKSRPL